MLTGTGLLASGTYGYLRVKNNQANYAKLVAETWHHFDQTGDKLKSQKEVMNELIHYATLAANSHNTQAWKFKISNGSIKILPDFSRRCPAVDPDDHHLFASLGCATENIVIAAESYGLKSAVSKNSTEDSIQIQFDTTVATASDLFLAIPNRQCTRSVYTGETIEKDQLNLLKTAAENYGVKAQLFTDMLELARIIEYVVDGNTQQMNDTAFIKELKHWIRFNKSDAIEHRDGLFAASSGSPEIPSWLGKLIFDFVFNVDSENDKYRKQIKSSSAVMAFSAATDDKQGWIDVGRSYQRTALQATALGIKHAFINQAVEVPAVRSELAQYLNIGNKRPDLLIRLGYGDEMPKSLRRPLKAVLV